MDLFEAINERYSFRGEYDNTIPPRSDLTKIVQAGILAPSGCNGQVVSFVIVDEPGLLSQIAEIIGNKPVCRTARAMIVCITDPRPVMGEVSFAAEDCAAAVENMLLAIVAMGYASVWLEGVLRYENRAERIARLLGVPAGMTVRVVLPIGVPRQPTPRREKLPFDKRAWFNRYRGEES